jgi:PAS domain S-box-containing protein
MDTSARPQLLRDLRARCDAVTDSWYQAIARTSYVSLDVVDLRRRIGEWTEQSIELLVAEPFEHDKAQAIGSALAGLHYVQPEALGRSVGVLANQLLGEMPGDLVQAVRPNLGALLEDITTGFCQQAFKTLLSEQEEIRSALVSELRSAGKALRSSRDRLEIRVAERTTELASINEALRSEISERKRAQEALSRSEAKYRALLESASDGVYTLDLEGRFTFMSDVIVERSGFPREWYIGKSFFDVVRPEYRKQCREYFEAALRGETVPVIQIPYKGASGETLWVELNTTGLRENNQIVGLHAVSRDITERKRTELALRESEEMWRSLVENAPDLVLTVDRDLRIQFANRSMGGSGPSAEEPIGKHVGDYAVPEHRSMVREAIREVFVSGANVTYEVPVVLAGGQAWYATRAGPIRSDGEVVAALLVSRDITERKRIEEMKDNLIRDVSHELRTPLAKMHMSLELLLEVLEEGDRGRLKATNLAERTLRNVERLLQTVEAMLDLSALEAGVQPYEKEKVCLEELIEEVVAEMEPLSGSRGLHLVSIVPPDLPLVLADRGKLYRVLINLLDNACKFSDRGSVVVSAEVQGREVEIAVRDSGQGILPENLDRIFDRFFQEKPRFEGVGVGLSICRAIAEGHGGRIWAESPGRGQGSTLRFTLPLEED